VKFGTQVAFVFHVEGGRIPLIQ